MTRKGRKALRISAEQAAQALHILVSEGRIAAREVYAVLERRQKLLEELRQRLAALGDDGLKLIASVRRDAPIQTRRIKKAARKAGRRARRQISAATRAAWKAQGAYMAAVRALPKAARAKIKEIRRSSGVRAAIATAKRMAR